MDTAVAHGRHRRVRVEIAEVSAPEPKRLVRQQDHLGSAGGHLVERERRIAGAVGEHVGAAAGREEIVHVRVGADRHPRLPPRSEEHTSELQSHLISYAVFCLKKKKKKKQTKKKKKNKKKKKKNKKHTKTK